MSDQNNNYKIALIGDSLSNGGAEKVHALLSIYFQNQGFDVYNCILIDDVTYSFSGNLLNLGTIHATSNSITRKWFRFVALQKFISTNKFDCVIDFRMRPSFFLEFILSRFVYPKHVFYTVHSAIFEFYFPKNAFLSQLIYKDRTIVCVSSAIQKEVEQTIYIRKVFTMHNPIDLDKIKNLCKDAISEINYILAIGNMKNDIKQIDKLIVAYSKSILPKHNIKLMVLGEGKFKKEYQKLVEDMNLQNLVVFKGTIQNPFPYYHNAKFSVLSSKNEGFPNAIIEALACETPVVAFDCFSGPREIISNNHNGILVENQNFEKLIEAMNLMIADNVLYQNCKKNAVQSVQKFSIEKIGSQWLELINP